jgi:hypothetical protein
LDRNASPHALIRTDDAAPWSLNWAEAAALPLTAVTAWEALFDRLDVKKPLNGIKPSILIIGAPAAAAPSPFSWPVGGARRSAKSTQQLEKAHAFLEADYTKGKLVLEGF